MSRHTTHALSTSSQTLKVLQLNTRRSSAVIHSLLNDQSSLQFHFLLIQEPYIFPLSNSPITHPSWNLFSPHAPHLVDTASPEDSTVKSLIYANKTIPTTAIKPIPITSNCITAICFSLTAHTFVLISSYAPPKQSHKLQGLRDILRNYPPFANYPRPDRHGQ